MRSANPEDRLSQYFDGELPVEDAEALETELSENAELRAKLEGLAHLRVLIAESAEAQADDVDADALWGAIEARLGKEEADDDPMLPKAVRPDLAVLAGGKPSEKKSTKPARKNVVWVSIATSLAVAAAVLLFVFRPGTTGTIQPPTGGSLAERGSEVVEVDFGYSTGAIFSVEGQQGERYAVVWISDEKPEVAEPERTQ